MIAIDRATSPRLGIIAAPIRVTPTAADVAVASYSVPFGPDEPTRSAGGGASRDDESARRAAIGEALERYAATTAVLPIFSRAELPSRARVVELSEFGLFTDEQLAAPDFPHRERYLGDVAFTDVYRLQTNEVAYAPASLVGLTDHFGPFATSSGLAAAPTYTDALISGVAELIERDALMITWLHGVAPPVIAPPDEIAEEVRAIGGRVHVFDATPAYSPYPVAIVAGSLPLHGRFRQSLGAACRPTWSEAVDKAYVEWTQGVVYAGHTVQRNDPVTDVDPDGCSTFEQHARYYTDHPEQWEQLPIFGGPIADPPPDCVDRSLAHVAETLESAGIELWYRDLTTVDLAQVGLRVVRVLAPRLCPIHADHQWRYLGGSAPDLAWRFPSAHSSTGFPTPFPHPLG